MPACLFHVRRVGDFPNYYRWGHPDLFGSYVPWLVNREAVWLLARGTLRDFVHYLDRRDFVSASSFATLAWLTE
jgi:hypothetical protein